MQRSTLSARALPLLRRATTPATVRTLSTSRGLRAEGSTGSGTGRPGGAAQGDAFTKREQASEDYYVREQEKAKLNKLKEDLARKQRELKQLEDEVKKTEGSGN